MKSKNIKQLILLPTLSLILGSCTFSPSKTPIDDGWNGDPLSYMEDKPVSYDEPHLEVTSRADDTTAVVKPDIIVIHYHNDDKLVGEKRFYTWVTGVDGVERKPDHSSAEDMDITLDLSLLEEGYAEAEDEFCFIIKKAGTWSGQSQDTRVIYADNQDKIQEVDGKQVMTLWTIPGEGNKIELYATENETKFPKIKTAKFTDWKTIHCETTGEIPLYYKVYAFDRNYLMGTPQEQINKKQYCLFKSGTPTSSSFDIKFNQTAKINIQYLIESEYADPAGRVQKVIVSSENLYENDRFEQYYTYTGNGTDDLGCTYTPTQTTFKVWAPTAAIIYVNVYNDGTPKNIGGSDSHRQYVMTYQPKGIWTKTITGDLKGKFYTYEIINSNGKAETIDPYAKACGINGVRGAIYDNTSDEANPTGLKNEWNSLKSKWNTSAESGRYDISSPQDLSAYEVHIRDLTMDESWGGPRDKAGTYDGFCLSGTTYTDTILGKTVTTGFDHIKELGVRAIQIIPVFDNDNEERPAKMKFNWGYNPLNYNCVEGGYSSNPADPLARIREYKNLVYQYATKGEEATRVIMDVVYNHVSSATSSSFHKLMPKYYFRYNDEWAFYDGSGCNNEVKTEAPMMSKFIVESLCWWAKEYQIKGFRFDLMGLIDTWTLRTAAEELYKIDPDIVIYGEGWTSGGYHGAVEYDSQGNLVNGGAETSLVYQQLYATNNRIGVGAFNDTSRNATRGSNDDGYNNNPYPTYGFVNQGTGDVGDKSWLVAQGMKGVHEGKGGNPAQTINYVSCHDNYTLWDQLQYTLATKGYNADHTPTYGGTPDAYDLVKATLASHASVMMSNGIGFIQGGEELYRTKQYSAADLKEGAEKGTIRPYPTYPHYSEDPEVEIATSDVRLFAADQIITHNSYKASDYCNSFKWNRKVSVDNKDMTWAIDVWKAMIAERKNAPKYSYDDLFGAQGQAGLINSWTANGSDSSNFNGVSVFATWINGSGSESVTNKGYYCIFAGRDGGYIPFGNDGTLVFTNNTYGISEATGGLNLAPYTYAVYKKGY